MEKDKVAYKSPLEEAVSKRREFLKKGLIISSLAGISGTALFTGCKEVAGEEVTPAEDLMREHGLLNRILLIYDFNRNKIVNGEEYSPENLKSSAQIIRSFIEDYHEKLEENFLFPRFEKANVLVDLITVLRSQHAAGRKLTDRIIQITSAGTVVNDSDGHELAELLETFNYMYRPHEAREDTVLFPEIRKVVTGKDYSDLGESFEEKEHELFGEQGFEGMVAKVAEIEKALGIYDLSEFTPVL
jgi:hemerythrin-like domain-containing protein